MINTFLLKSNRNNYYAYDFSKKEMINISFFMYYYLQKMYQNIDEETIIREYSNTHSVEYKSDLEYLKCLLSNNYLTYEIEEFPIKFKHISEKDIENYLIFPNQITFEVTDACNLNCYYCSYGNLYGNYDKRESKYIKLETGIEFINYIVKNVENSVNKLKTKQVYISFYGGEPLLNFTFIKGIVLHCKQLKTYNLDFVFTMTTNGLLLNKHIDFLVENNFKILISLDGDKMSNSYRKLHNGNNSFDLLINNVNDIKKNYPSFFDKNINFNSVLHNKNNIEDIYEFFWDNFNKIPSIGELNSRGIKPDKKQEFEKLYKNADINFNNSNNQKYLEDKVFIGLPHVQFASLFLFKYTNYIGSVKLFKNMKIFPTGTCLPFSKKIHITVNGKILPCEKIDHQNPLGYITNGKVDIDKKVIVDFYNSQYNNIIKQCKSCYNIYSCTKCLYYMDYNNGNYICSSYSNKRQFEYLLTDMINQMEKNPEIYNKIFSEIIVE